MMIKTPMNSYGFEVSTCFPPTVAQKIKKHLNLNDGPGCANRSSLFLAWGCLPMFFGGQAFGLFTDVV